MLLLLLACAGGARAATPDLELHGDITFADYHHYRSVPFTVPAGVERITVVFDYTGKDAHGVIDLGLLGADGSLRGWSGGSKRVFTVSSVDATPSYLPTPTVAGAWALLLGVPNIRADQSASYTAQVYFSRGLAVADEPEVLRAPLKKGPAWYRGDLHMHTAHSDGSCASEGGANIPCPLYLTVQAAAARQLDFIAITEHNTVSHAQAIRELQPYYDHLLLMPGRELTTFSGHANLFGTVAPLDFRIGAQGYPDWNGLLDAAARLGGLVSVNHPSLPSGEMCMGCGWSNPADLRKVQAVEAVNGTDADAPLWSGIAFWQEQLQHGLRPTAIGGSDNHKGGQARGNGNHVGTPTTVVYAPELSQLAILDAIRAGHVFVDVDGSRDRMLELSAAVGDGGAGRRAIMGDSLAAGSGTLVHFTVHVAHAAGARIELILDGADADLLAQADIDSDDAVRDFNWIGDGQRHWLRASVRDTHGHLLLLGNPIYLQP
ncbi:CehA/McbA family metallohydrolase [Rugamonas sp.]|uniref:CehA/McbA family metallohydrolase n=1 Tax=Rugamonas sp. TaxID=1926287 RepID=UPI0025EFDBE5|nr:CehA/McbA family metallohydrolase [Rugamonas sp.]